MSSGIILSALIGIVVLGLTQVSYADDEEIDVGNSALWVEISGNLVYVTNPIDNKIIVIDSNTNEIVNTIATPGSVIILEVVEEKNKLYASIDGYPNIFVYDLTTGESLGEIEIGESEMTLHSNADKNYGQREHVTFQTDALGLSYNPNTELLYVIHSTLDRVHVIDTNIDKDLGSIITGKKPHLITIDEVRNIGYVSNHVSSTVSVLDLQSNSLLKNLNTGFAPEQMVIDYDNNRLYVTHHASPHVTVIDLRTQEIETKIQVDGPTHAIALNTNANLIHVFYLPDSSYSGIISGPEKVKFIDTNTNQIVGSIELSKNPFTIDIDSENQRSFASVINEGTVVVVNLSTHPEYQRILSKSPTGGGCLIATAAYGTELAPQVQFLREIRDNTVMSTESGAAFMTGFNQLYYSFSPIIADMERENPMFQEVVRAFITPMISTLSIMTLAEDGSEVEVLGLGISVIALNLGLYLAVPAVTAWQIKKRI